MARLQPILSPSELTLVDQMADLTGSKRTEVIKSALAVYHWFIRHAITGGQVVARKSTGEEVALETPELAALEGKGQKLSPEELGILAKRLATAPDAAEAARIKERLTRGFYGI
jgi:hypothetical protein